MATIRATCPTCGDVEMGTQDVQAMICTTTQAGSYAYRCPVCRLATASPAPRRVIELLVSAGVNLVTWQLPAELGEAHPGGPPISYDDLIEFHELLETPGWAEDLLAPAPGPSDGLQEGHLAA